MEEVNQQKINNLLERTEKNEQQVELLVKEMAQLMDGKVNQGDTDKLDIIQTLKTENEKMKYRINILKTATEREMSCKGLPEVMTNVCDKKADNSQEDNSFKKQGNKITKCHKMNSAQQCNSPNSERVKETKSSKSQEINTSKNQETNDLPKQETNTLKSREHNDIKSSKNQEHESDKETKPSKSQETNDSRKQETNEETKSFKNQEINSSKSQENDSSIIQPLNSSQSNDIRNNCNNESSSGSCFLCFQPTPHQCPHCPAWSCPDHLSSHRPASSCLPFAVRFREEVGRYAVATRDIQAMEIVLEDLPAVHGPNYETEAVCLECIGRVDGSILCHHCNFPLCSEACRDGPNHASECAVFAKLDKKVNILKFGPGTYALEYGCITVLRLLSLRDREPGTWQRLGYLMDHEKERRGEHEDWKMFQKNVVDFLRIICGLEDVYSEEEVHRAIGLLRTNAAHLELPNMTASHTSGKVLYPTFSFLSHSCLCNATYTTIPQDAKLVLKAQRDIKCGEEITIQYISFLHGNIQRRRDIRSCWFFTCSCPRCEDVTELGTDLCGILCEACDGSVLPNNNLVDTGTWICRMCGVTVSTTSVEAVVKKCEGELWQTHETDVDAYDRMLKEYTTKFTKNHFHILMIKKNLARALIQQPQVTREMAERNVSLTEDFLATYSIVDPGYSKWRGIMLYDLVKIRLGLADRAFGAKEIGKEEFMERINLNIGDLEYVVKALAIEPKESKEGRILMLAAKALNSAKDCIRFSSWL